MNTALRATILLASAALLVACGFPHEREFRREAIANADQVSKQNKICPVHRVEMQAAKVPIFYGKPGKTDADPSSELVEKRFPFADEFIRGGCVVGRFSPTIGRVYHCSDCLRAKASWTARHKN